MVKNYDDLLSRFHPIPERNGRTDRQTDGQICYINIARQYADSLTRDKNEQLFQIFASCWLLTSCGRSEQFAPSV